MSFAGSDRSSFGHWEKSCAGVGVGIVGVGITGTGLDLEAARVAEEIGMNRPVWSLVYKIF